MIDRGILIMFKKNLSILCIFGGIYLILELCMRTFRCELVGWHGLSRLSLAGWTTLWMFPIGGLCGLFVGLLNERIKLPVLVMALIGTLGIFTIELITGFLFNILLNLNLWSYHGWPLNILGQITLLYAPLWFLIFCPLAMWIDDVLRHLIYEEEKPGTLFSFYKRFFTLN